MIQAVIFDMDGVIIDSHKAAYDLLTETANKYGADITKDEIMSWGSLSSKQFWMKVKDEYHLTESVDFYISHYDRDEEIRRYKNIGIISGIPELIKGLKLANLKIALATSASKYRMSAVINIKDLKLYFDCLVCDEDVSESKPNPEIFLLAAQQMHVNPANCVVIEDSENGLIAAKRAGMKSIGYTGSSGGEENLSLATITIKSFVNLSISKIIDF